MEISEDENLYNKSFEESYINNHQNEVFQKPGEMNLKAPLKRERHDSDIPFSYLSPQGGSFLLSPFYQVQAPPRKNSDDSIQGSTLLHDYMKQNRGFQALTGNNDPSAVKNGGIEEEGGELIEMENMEDPNGFRLDRITEGEGGDKRNVFYQSEKTMNPPQITRPRTASNITQNKHKAAKKVSIQNEIHSYIYNLIEKCDLTNYREHEQSLKFLKNLENWTFTEGTHSDENKFFQFTRFFINRYENLLKTVIECSEKTEFKNVLKHLWDFSLELHNDLLNFIVACDENFCFNMLKNTSKIKNSKAATNMNNFSKENPFVEGVKILEPATNLPIQSKLFAREPAPRVNPTFTAELSPNTAQEKSIVAEKKQPVENTNAVTKVKIENESEGGSDGSEPKKNRRIWTSQETAYIETLFMTYSPEGIPQEKIEEFARLYNRTIPSIKSKIQKCKKKLMQEPDSSRLQMSFAEGNFQPKMCHSGKYEIPLEKMLKIALSHFPEQRATKIDLFSKVSEMFFRGNKSEDSWKKSASQIIASCHNFLKVKGYYSLTEKAKSLNPHSKDLGSLSFKLKLVYVLKNLPENKGNIKSITEKYLVFFKDIDDIDLNDSAKRKNLKNSILKTLNQNCEFDTQNSKTIYGLRNASKN